MEDVERESERETGWRMRGTGWRMRGTESARDGRKRQREREMIKSKEWQTEITGKKKLFLVEMCRREVHCLG